MKYFKYECFSLLILMSATNFKREIDDYHGLKWIFSPRCKRVDFLDITISLDDNMKLTTTLFEKLLNLYLYIPPHSTHPPRRANRTRHWQLPPNPDALLR